MFRNVSEIRSGLHPAQWTLLLGVVALGVVPLALAALRLQSITGIGMIEAVQLFSDQNLSLIHI